MKHLLLSLITISLLAPLAAAYEAHTRLDIELDRSTMFVLLPHQVTHVTQGPDGRVWLTLRYGGPKNRTAFESLQVLLREEFNEKMPQVSYARPILFEPTGRVWFAADPWSNDQGNFTHTILGYDGKTFVEHNIHSDEWQLSVNAAFADGQGGGAFFCTRNGIHIYDGKQWSTHKIPTHENAPLSYQLFTEPDNKGIIAVPHKNTDPFLRWQNGKWTQFTQPPSLPLPPTNKITHTIPLASISGIHATLNDGTRFFSIHNNFYAYHPQGKDHRVTLQHSHATHANVGTLTGDGNYWFIQPWTTDHLCTIARFDGTKIETFGKIPSSHISNTFIPGHDGFIICSGRNYSLVSPKGVFSADQLEDLIAKHPIEVTLAFVGTRPIARHNDPYIQADINGNVWLIQSQWTNGQHIHTLKVFTSTNRQWLDATNALKQAGSHEGRATMLFPLGESKKILAVNDRRGENTKSIFILSIHEKEGGIQIEPLDDQYCDIGRNNPHNVIYSPRGEPWLGIHRQTPNGTTYLTCRYSESGLVQTIDRLDPIAADSDGSLLVMDGSTPHPLLKLFRNDALIEDSAIPVPRSREKITFIAPGIICQPTDLGLQITNLNDPANPTIYTGATACSSLGFAIAHIHAPATTGKPPPPNIFFYPLKKQTP
ncbi:MAG: hypothetical protein FWD53_08170 [Phycisphaerales bacterium]|nr:hypothetical protein [Phycisphaerales bacterium]